MNPMQDPQDKSAPTQDAESSAFRLTLQLAQRWKLMLVTPLLAGLCTLGLSYLIEPTFTSRTSFLPPQQQQGGGSAALASLTALAGVAGAAAGLRTPADQYVALMQSITIQDRLIDRFELVKVYESKFRVDARRELISNTRIALSKRDGIITVEADDTSPQRAADLANAHVEELRRLTATLAITEAQQRRVFFEGQLKQTRDNLAAAQLGLTGSGFNAGALQAEPKAAAERYAKLRAEVTSAEVRLQAVRSNLQDSATEVVQLQSALSALRSQLAQLEHTPTPVNEGGYISRYREFKYQESLFELLSRQFEFARVDEAREGALIQVIDKALPAEKKSKPKRLLTAVGVTAGVGLMMLIWIAIQTALRGAASDPRRALKLLQLRRALRGQLP